MATIMFDANHIPFVVDPNSQLGLQLEGWHAQHRNAARDANPYTRSHPGSLAEQYWFEGFDASHARCLAKAAGAENTNG